MVRLRTERVDPERFLRRVLPRSLFGRTLLIVLVPLILSEAVALQIFYGSHLDVLSRRLAFSVAGEIAFVVDAADHNPARRQVIFNRAAQRFEFAFHEHPGRPFVAQLPPHAFGPVDQDLIAALRSGLGRPFALVWRGPPGMIRVDIAEPGGELTVDVPRKRLYVGQLYIFFAWLAGTTILLLGLATLFLRNQVRGIKRLAGAAEAFGMGRDTGPIRPEGAAEIRRAGAAFNRMRDRVRRFLAQRTAMLAGVSHDLRTPLTRMRLALAMLPEELPDRAEIERDIEEMERLIRLYLEFARGEGEEQPVATDFSLLIGEVVAQARRHEAQGGARVVSDVDILPPVLLRPEGMRRVLSNLLDNAMRHARLVRIAAMRDGERAVRIVVDDDGPGIPADRRARMMRPFESGSAAGTGLGLAIALDIITAHGGELVLEDSPLGGLRARIGLPL